MVEIPGHDIIQLVLINLINSYIITGAHERRFHGLLIISTDNTEILKQRLFLENENYT